MITESTEIVAKPGDVKQAKKRLHSQWNAFLALQVCFTVILTLYALVRNDIFSILLMSYYFCYAALTPMHIPYGFYKYSSWALYVTVMMNCLWMDC